MAGKILNLGHKATSWKPRHIQKERHHKHSSSHFCRNVEALSSSLSLPKSLQPSALSLSDSSLPSLLAFLLFRDSHDDRSIQRTPHLAEKAQFGWMHFPTPRHRRSHVECIPTPSPTTLTMAFQHLFEHVILHRQRRCLNYQLSFSFLTWDCNMTCQLYLHLEKRIKLMIGRWIEVWTTIPNPQQCLVYTSRAKEYQKEIYCPTECDDNKQGDRH